MTGNDSRSRQAAGQRTGGQFKAEQHTEGGIELEAEPAQGVRRLPSSEYIIGSPDEVRGDMWENNASAESLSVRHPHLSMKDLSRIIDYSSLSRMEGTDPEELRKNLAREFGDELAYDAVRLQVELSQAPLRGASSAAADALVRTGAPLQNIAYEPFNNAISTVTDDGIRVWMKPDGQGNAVYQDPESRTYYGTFPSFALAADAVRQMGQSAGPLSDQDLSDRAKAQQEQAAKEAAEKEAAKASLMGPTDHGFEVRHGKGSAEVLERARQMHSEGKSQDEIYEALNQEVPYTVARDAARLGGGVGNVYPRGTGASLISSIERSGASFAKARKVRNEDALQLDLDSGGNVSIKASKDGFTTKDGSQFSGYREAALHAVDTAAFSAFVPEKWKEHTSVSMDEQSNCFSFDCKDTGAGPAQFLVTYDGTAIPSQETTRQLGPERTKIVLNKVVSALRDSQASHPAAQPFRSLMQPTKTQEVNQ